MKTVVRSIIGAMAVMVAMTVHAVGPVEIGYVHISSFDPVVFGNYCVTTLPTRLYVEGLNTTTVAVKQARLKWGLYIAVPDGKGGAKEKKLVSGSGKWKNESAHAALVLQQDITAKLVKKLAGKDILPSLVAGEMHGTLKAVFSGTMADKTKFTVQTNVAVTFSLDRYVMPGTADVTKTIGPEGGTVTDATTSIIVTIPSNAVQQEAIFSFTRIVCADGSTAIVFQCDQPVTGAIPIQFTGALTNLESESYAEKGAQTGWPWIRRWFSPFVIFPLEGGPVRCNFDEGTIKLAAAQAHMQLTVHRYVASRLHCQTGNPSQMAGKTPILLIHGYHSIWPGGDPVLENGNGWSDLPELLQQGLGDNYIIFDFRWLTNARFKDVAGDLKEAIALIKNLTGNRVHIIAHSFGGVLARTFLQSLAVGRNDTPLANYDQARANVASLITVGTPHSGIAGAAGMMHGVSFPRGQDSWVFIGAQQVSVHQAGEPVPELSPLFPLVRVENDAGEIPAALSQNAFPNGLPVYVLIGITAGNTVDNGDALISFEGERFMPNLRRTTPVNVRQSILGATVTEQILGSKEGVTVIPGEQKPTSWKGNNGKGYKHTASARRNTVLKPCYGRPEIEMKRADHSDHATYANIMNWFDEMVLIPAGAFNMGNCMDTGEGYSEELPVHNVNISGFLMDKYEVSKAQWDGVYTWAVSHGYSFDNPGDGKAASHPVQTVNWYDCAKWCNARSEKKGLAPCYYTTAARKFVYRSGQLDLSSECVDWSAKGYRLPTEAEWEKAARGGTPGHRFPWSDANTIQHARANYYSDASYTYDTSPTRGYHPTFNDGVYPYTSPVGYFAPNGYGLVTV